MLKFTASRCNMSLLLGPMWSRVVVATRSNADWTSLYCFADVYMQIPHNIFLRQKIVENFKFNVEKLRGMRPGSNHGSLLERQ